MTPRMIDVHCHLVDNKFKADVDDVIERAKAAGVERAVIVPEYESQFEKVLELKRRHPGFVIAAVGVHPIQKKNRSVRLEHVDAVEGFLTRHQEQIGCLGEVGLDFTVPQFKVSEEDRLIQEEVFRRQIRLAKQFGLPLNVHSRSSEEAVLRVLLSESPTSGVILHAFGGSPSLATTGVDAGYFYSIPPAFSLSDHGRHLVETVPLDLLLLETDSPVLGVERGVRNEPANCIISARFIAEVKGVPLDDVIRVTTENAKRLFRV